jgi:histidinol-phosphate aminotransferase
VALLHNWCSTATQDWLAQSRHTLQCYKAVQLQALQSLGWQCCPSETSFFVARPSLPAGMDLAQMLATLRGQGIKLRDCASFGLSGHVRLCVHTPQAQAVLLQVLRGLGGKG